MRVCHHANVARIYDAFEDDQKIYIVMEFIEGADLIHFIKKRLTEEDISEVFVQMVEGVRHLHELGIVHRDLKLENILVVQDTDNKGQDRVRIKLIDLGLANILSS
jgi:serine/threonine protein kinase